MRAGAGMWGKMRQCATLRHCTENVLRLGRVRTAWEPNSQPNWRLEQNGGEIDISCFPISISRLEALWSTSLLTVHATPAHVDVLRRCVVRLILFFGGTFNCAGALDRWPFCWKLKVRNALFYQSHKSGNGLWARDLIWKIGTKEREKITPARVAL